MTNKDLLLKAKNKEDEGDLDSAIELYKKALEQDSKNHVLQIELGNLYAMTNRFSLA